MNCKANVQHKTNKKAKQGKNTIIRINHKSNKIKSEPALIYVYSEEKMVLLLRVIVAPLVLVFTNLYSTCGRR